MAPYSFCTKHQTQTPTGMEGECKHRSIGDLQVWQQGIGSQLKRLLWLLLLSKSQPLCHSSVNNVWFPDLQWVSDSILHPQKICLALLEAGRGVELGSGHMPFAHPSTPMWQSNVSDPWSSPLHPLRIWGGPFRSRSCSLLWQHLQANARFGNAHPFRRQGLQEHHP